MRIILDTNVFVSGVFFSGPPYQILSAWRDGRIQLVISREILDEYQRVGRVLAEQYPGVDLDPLISLLVAQSESVGVPPLPDPVCEDRDDDKFLACALSGEVRLIVSGDRHLLRVSGYRGIEVVRPRASLEEHLMRKGGS